MKIVQQRSQPVGESMTGGNTVNQLMEQLEANRVVAKMKIVQQQIDIRLETLQSSVDALITYFNDHMGWLRQHWNPNHEGGTSSTTEIQRRRMFYKLYFYPLLLERSLNLKELRSMGVISKFIKKTLKVGIPRFNDEDVKGWIQLCNQIFLFHSTHDVRRVMFVAMHVDGLARLGLESKFHSLEGLTWI